MERLSVPESARARNGILDIVWSGTFDRVGVTESLEAVEKVLETQNPISILIRNEVEVFHFNATDARQVAFRLEALQRAGVVRTCMLVNKPVHYGIGRMINAFCEMSGVPFGIFWDEESALLWLQTGRTDEAG